MHYDILPAAAPQWLDTLQSLRHDFYQRPAYVALEARRQGAIAEAILVHQGDQRLLLPYLRRALSCGDSAEKPVLGHDLTAPADIYDAVSPYGYGGLLLSPGADADFVRAAMAQVLEIFTLRGICSVFIRLHPILNQDFLSLYPTEFGRPHSQVVTVNLELDAAEIWRQTRPEHRTKINRCRRAGFVAHILPVQQRLDEFIAVYRETMERVGAVEFYHFSDDYFHQLAADLQDVLFLCLVEQEGAVACMGLFSECGGVVQYHLGGTRTAWLKPSPSVLMFDQVRQWGKARGNQVFNLGGGVGGSQDSLYHFKAGFSKQRHTFSLLKLIPQPTTYSRLVHLRARVLNIAPETLQSTAFFPAYRAAG